jgi:hypothetical protein
MIGVLALVPVACNGQSRPNGTFTDPVSGPLEAEIARSISIRTENGLRADREWVLRAVTDPNSVRRYLILVTAEEAAQIDARAVAKAIAFRKDIGMRADEIWVRAVSNDPRAVVLNGIAMTPDEARAFDDRVTAETQIAPAIVDYGERFPSEWAGAFIDSVSGDIVASFSAHVDEHTANLLALFVPGTAQVEVRMVKHSTAELDALNAPIWSDEGQTWLKGLGIQVLGGGSRVVENDVRLEVAASNPDGTLVARITEHFGGVDWLTVDVQIAAPPPTRFGDLRVTVFDPAHKPVAGVACWLHPDIAGYAGDDAIRLADDGGLCRWDGIGAGGYDVEIWRRPNESLLGTGRVTVPTNGTGHATVAVISR